MNQQGNVESVLQIFKGCVSFMNKVINTEFNSQQSSWKWKLLPHRISNKNALIL
jgi:hypothetical protein